MRWDTRERSTGRWVAAVAAVISLLASAACGGGPLVKRYEYEEELYLSVDGSAIAFINASVPALVVLRGIALDPRPWARLDRAKVRSFYTTAATRVTRVSTSRRSGRRFVHVRVETDDVRELSKTGPLSWSRYRLERANGILTYTQLVGAAASHEVGNVGWTDAELVAFRLHLPSRIQYHNAPSRRVERGNILEWEQSLQDRRASVPLALEVRMEAASILFRTLSLFILTIVAALSALGASVWWIARKGRTA